MKQTTFSNAFLFLSCLNNIRVLNTRKLKCLLTFILLFTALWSSAQTAYYVRSVLVGEPWGSNTNIDAMNTVFGAGEWIPASFETLDPNVVFSTSACFVFLEGSDYNADELESFLAANLPAIEDWVEGGGHLLLNSAPNEGNGMSFGFGDVTLNYAYYTPIAEVQDAEHPIANGPYIPVGTSWHGNSFGHATISGSGLTPLIADQAAPNNVVLAEKISGLGKVLFGGMTTNNFHTPVVQGENLRANILYYLASSQCMVCAAPTWLANNGTTATSVVLVWNEVDNAESYRVRYKKTNVGGAGTLVGAAGNSKYITGLSPSTEYVWQIKTICSIDDNLKSDWSLPQYFTTANLKLEGESIAETLEVYPNPFSASTTITFSINESSNVTVELFDMTGRMIQTLLSENAESGIHELNLNREQLPAGIYMLKMKTPSSTATQSIIIQ